MANTHTHTLIFTGQVPADEMERADVFAHPDVKAAKIALQEAFKAAGHPHTFESKVTRPGAKRGPRAPKLKAAE